MFKLFINFLERLLWCRNCALMKHSISLSFWSVLFLHCERVQLCPIFVDASHVSGEVARPRVIFLEIVVSSL